MVKATPSIPLDRLSGSKTQLMTDMSKLVINRGSAPLMAMPCSWFVEVLFFLTNPQMRILRGTQLTGPHEWDPSVLDFSYPSDDGRASLVQ